MRRVLVALVVPALLSGCALLPFTQEAGVPTGADQEAYVVSLKDGTWSYPAGMLPAGRYHIAWDSACDFNALGIDTARDGLTGQKDVTYGEDRSMDVGDSCDPSKDSYTITITPAP